MLSGDSCAGLLSLMTQKLYHSNQAETNMLQSKYRHDEEEDEEEEEEDAELALREVHRSHAPVQLQRSAPVHRTHHMQVSQAACLSRRRSCIPACVLYLGKSQRCLFRIHYSPADTQAAK